MSQPVNRRVLPGFGLSLGVTLAYLGAIVLLPLMAAAVTLAGMSWGDFIDAVNSRRALAAFGLTFGASFAAAAISTVLGLLIAWVLVRYEFPLKVVFDSLVDVPFALPTAVAGLVFATLYAPNGPLGRFLVPLGAEVAYTRLGVVLVLVFVGFPFVVRAVQPVLEEIDTEVEEASASLGAGRFGTFRRVLFPQLRPALITGFALAFARGLGEYGSVVFISGNVQFRTEIAPVLIVGKLEQFRYAEATAISVVLMAASFVTLIIINYLEKRAKR